MKKNKQFYKLKSQYYIWAYGVLTYIFGVMTREKSKFNY